MFAFKNTDRSNVTFFLLCFPLVRSPQWLNTRSAGASEAGKAESKWRQNRDDSFSARSSLHRPHHLTVLLLTSRRQAHYIQVHAQNFSLVDEIVCIFVVVVVIMTKIISFSPTKVSVFVVVDEKHCWLCEWQWYVQVQTWTLVNSCITWMVVWVWSVIGPTLTRDLPSANAIRMISWYHHTWTVVTCTNTSKCLHVRRSQYANWHPQTRQCLHVHRSQYIN